MTHSVAITAIMPIYNGRRHCVESIASVLSQSVPPAELILVDDGSTDDSVQVAAAAVAELQARDGISTTVRFLEQSNAGQSAARNAAAAVAEGEFLAFIDQDDLWAPHHLEVLAAQFAGHPEVGWVYSDFDEIDGDGMLVTQRFIAHAELQHPKRALDEILEGDLMILPSASLLRATAFAESGGFDPALCGYEDDDLFIRMFRHGWSSAFVPEALTRFRIHGTSASASVRFQRSRVLFLDNLIASVPDNPRMNRYWVRTLVQSRLMQSTMAEYSTALVVHDLEGAALLADTATQISARFQPSSPQRRAQLWLMRRPAVMRQFLAVYERMPSVLRPRINKGLSLRNPGDRLGR